MRKIYAQSLAALALSAALASAGTKEARPVLRDGASGQPCAPVDASARITPEDGVASYAMRRLYAEADSPGDGKCGGSLGGKESI